jgi:hypothetical protein
MAVRGGNRAIPAAVRRTRALSIVALAAVLATAVATSVGTASAGVGLPAKVVPIAPPVSTATYPAVDYGKTTSARDDRYAKTTWRVVEQTGNCCENYLTTTPGGRLLDFGGSYINYSDDRGLTWRQVQPLAPLVNGEGAIVVAPDGDVLGVEWDPYSGDHLQTYKYEADTQQWQYNETPLHQPFYDREWISVVPGPVTVGGQTYPYVSFVKGGYPTKEIYLYSTDGLTYTDITSKAAQQILTGATTQGPLATTAAAANDWIQPNTGGHMTPLGRSDVLAGPDLSSEWALFHGATFGWSSYRLPDGSQPQGLFQVDSAGRVHDVIPASDRASFDYRISTDGGATWQSVTVPLPRDLTIEEMDFRANRSAGVAAVAIHTQNQATFNDQDIVYKLDITTDTPFVKRLYRVGLGDAGATAGVGNDVRFDFDTVAVFADGRVAVSFIDSTTTDSGGGISPAAAIELDTKLGGKVKPEPAPPPPVLGTPYASYTFDSGSEGWTTSGVPSWSRSAPGTKTGTDDPGTVSFGIEGPAQYVDNVDASLTSPPIATQAGLTVLQFWLKTNTEDGFDYVNGEWSADGSTWHGLGQYSGRNDAYPGWNQVTLGFDSPGGNVQVRFHFTSDLLCSALSGAACGIDVTGARVDEVVVGKQAA